MSRAPVHETHSSSLTTALTPFGVIDFVDNHCLAAPAAPAVHGGVVGGPPAYLDAHGIRYVPAVSLEAAPQEEHAPPALHAEPRAPVTPYDLESRVDERIRQFMRDRSALGGQCRPQRALGDDYDLERTRRMEQKLRRMQAAAEDDLDTSELRKLRVEVEAANASASAGHKLSHAASKKVGKAREDLQRGKIDF